MLTQGSALGPVCTYSVCRHCGSYLTGPQELGGWGEAPLVGFHEMRRPQVLGARGD